MTKFLTLQTVLIFLTFCDWKNIHKNILNRKAFDVQITSPSFNFDSSFSIADPVPQISYVIKMPLTNPTVELDYGEEISQDITCSAEKGNHSHLNFKYIKDSNYI